MARAARELFTPLPKEEREAKLREAGFEHETFIIWGKEVVVWIDPRSTAIPCIFTGLATHYLPTLTPDFRSCYNPILVNGPFEEGCEIGVEDIPSLEKLSEFYESIRQLLETKYGEKYAQVGVFGHSALGACAFDYAQRYPDHTHSVLAIASPVVFDIPKAVGMSKDHYESNFSPEKSLELFKFSPEEEKELAVEDSELRMRARRFEISPWQVPISTGSTQQEFVASYAQKAPMTFLDYRKKDSLIDNLFSYTCLDITFTRHFYGVIVPGQDFRHFLEETNKPILYVLGIGDSLVPVQHLDNLPSPLSSNVSVWIDEQSGHWPMHENPEGLCEQIRKAIFKKTLEEKSAVTARMSLAGTGDLT